MLSLGTAGTPAALPAPAVPRVVSASAVSESAAAAPGSGGVGTAGSESPARRGARVVVSCFAASLDTTSQAATPRLSAAAVTADSAQRNEPSLSRPLLSVLTKWCMARTLPPAEWQDEDQRESC